MSNVISKMVLMNSLPTFGYQVVCDKCLHFDMTNYRYERMKSRAGGSYHVDKGEFLS